MKGRISLQVVFKLEIPAHSLPASFPKLYQDEFSPHFLFVCLATHKLGGFIKRCCQLRACRITHPKTTTTTIQVSQKLQLIFIRTSLCSASSASHNSSNNNNNNLITMSDANKIPLPSRVSRCNNHKNGDSLCKRRCKHFVCLYQAQSNFRLVSSRLFKSISFNSLELVLYLLEW